MKTWSDNIKLMIKAACFLLVFLILFYFGQRLLQAKWIDGGKVSAGTTSTWIEFRELEPNTVDVLFMGTSHTYSAIDPMYIYENSGITGYTLSGPGLRFDLTYLALQDALKTQSPKVVWLDMSAVQFEFQQTEPRTQRVADQFPWSRTKLEFAIDPGSNDIGTLNILFPFLRYHARWEELGENDFRYAAGTLDETAVRGHYLNFKTVETEFYFYGQSDDPKSKCYIEGRSLEFLKKINALCKEEGIQLILYKIPSPTWYLVQSEGCAALAEEFGVPYLELFYILDEIGIDAKTDFRDKKNHMNQSGAEKVSAYLMRYMQENFELEDQRGKNQQWDEDLTLYHDRKAAIYDAAQKRAQKKAM